MHKRGSVLDIMVVIILGIAGALSFIVANLILTQVMTQFQSIESSNVTDVTDIMTYGINAIRAGDMIFAFIIVGLIIVSAVFAYYTPTQPILVLPAIFIWVFIIFVSAQYSNLYYDLTATSTLSSSAAYFTLTSTICNNFPLVALVHGIIILIATYMGRGRGDYGGYY